MTYLNDVLIPTLHPGDIVIINNIETHYIRVVNELLYEGNVEAFYLLPYNRDLKSD